MLFTGRFLTLDPARPEVEALAVHDGRIVYAGDRGGAERWVGPATRHIGVPGVAVPGLGDAHVHVLSLGEQLEQLDLRGLAKDEILSRVTAAARDLEPGEWVLGKGWDQGFWDPPELPSAAELDRVAPDHPVALTRIDLHAVWVNTAALALARVGPSSVDPPGGRVIRTRSGTPSGVLVDAAADPLWAALPPPSPEIRERRVRAALEQYARWGLTTVHDAGADQATLAIYLRLAKSGQLPVRVYAMVQSTGSETVEDLERWRRDAAAASPDRRFEVRAIKVMLDGALGSRGALLREPYRDAPTERGLELLTEEELEKTLRVARVAGFQVAAHVIGDRALDRALEVFERVGIEPAERHRLEHLSVLPPADLPRLVRLGIVASMQPNFIGEYARWAIERLGPERLRQVYVLRDVVEAGVVLAAGSDYPAADSGSPLTSLYCMVTRHGFRGEPEGGFFAEQALDVGTALRALTSGVAWAGFAEADRGILAVGRLADFTALAASPFEVAPEALRDLEVQMTVVGGEVTFVAAVGR